MGVALGYLVYVLAWEPAPFTLTFDDAWYYFGIARNVAGGRGSTFDGVNPTNGYHPLWLGVSTLAFKAGLDGMAAARALLAVQVVAFGATLVVLARTVALVVDGWPRATRREPAEDRRAKRWATGSLVAVFVVLVGNPFVVKSVVNGLESGVVVPLDAVLLWVVLRRGEERFPFLSASSRWRWGVGALLALIFLARTDAVLLLAMLGLWLLGEAARRRSGPRVWPVVEVLVLPAVTVVAYVAWSDAAFGTPFQVSGLIKRAELTAGTAMAFLAVVAIAVAAGWRGQRRVQTPARRRRSARFGRVAAVASRTAWFGAFCIVLVGYYAVLQTQQWLWYFAPVVLYGVLLLLVAVADVVETTLHAAPTRRPGTALAPVLAVFLVPLLALLAFEVDAFLDPTLRSIQEANRDGGRWIAANLPPGAVVASWDAGVVGYFADRPVVNLDGVVNSFAFYRAAQDGKVGQFLACEGVGFVANHGGELVVAGREAEDPDIRRFIGQVYGQAAADQAAVRYREPFVYSGTTTGSSGSESGERRLRMYVYEVPAAAVPPAGSGCGAVTGRT